MAEKILDTRIQLKYDSYANWSNTQLGDGKGAKFILKKGEVGYCEIPSGSAVATTAPTVLFKVGDGTHTFAELKWASALAADVHDWAKKTEEEFKEWVKTLVPIEVIDNGTGKFVTDVTATNDANGHHITITREDVQWGDLKGESPIGEGDLVINIGEGLTGSDVVTTFNSKDDVSTLIAHGAQPTTGSNATATAGTGNNNNTFISNVVIDKFGHVASVETKQANFTDNDTITKVAAGNKYVKVETQQNQFMVDEENVFEVSINEAELKALIGAETTAAMEFKGVTSTLPATGNKGDMYKLTAELEVLASNDAQGKGFTAKPGDAIVYEGDDEWYWIPAGDDIEDTWRPIAINEMAVDSDDMLEINSGTEDATLYGEFEVNQQKVKTKLVIPAASEDVAGLVKLGTEGGAEEYGAAASLINALDFADVEGDFVTAVTQNNGKIAVTKAEHKTSYLGIAGKGSDNVVVLHTDIQLSGNNQLSYDTEDDQTITFAPIAVTGNVNDLVQTAGDVLVFNCGTSTTVI